ncbi:MAG: hypothetical protein ABIY40_00900 [Rhodanobacteraceae bacterium]
MNTRTFRRGALIAALAVAGTALAPAAFARSHVSIGLGFNVPAVSLGVGDCINCGYRRPYYPAYYGPAYYDPGYYAPAPVYYNPYPAYGTVYYGGGYYHRGWRDRDDWRGRDRDDGHGHDRNDGHRH